MDIHSYTYRIRTHVYTYVFTLESGVWQKQTNIDNLPVLHECPVVRKKKIMPKYLLFALLLSNFREFGGTLLRGTRARDDQFPWLIQFYTISPCGGVLITPDWVLTAAQCVQYKRNSIVLYATGLNGTESSQAVSVKATYIYPQFQGYSGTRDHDNNIALLKLVRAFDTCGENVRFLDMAPVRLDDDYKTCLIFGWQSSVSLSSRVNSKPIQYSRVLLNAWRHCLYVHKGNASYRNVFCTVIEDANGQRACAGNPGSPVVCEDQNRRMVLLGIASFTNYSLHCGGLPTYLGVSVFRSWMQELIFGNRNMEHWDNGANEGGTGEQACKRQRYSVGVTRAGMNFRDSRIRNHTGREMNRRRYDSTKRKGNEYAYDVSWEPSRGKPPTSFDQIDDYTGILDPENSRNGKNVDVVRGRDEELSQYREIGRAEPYPQDDAEKELIAVPSQLERVAYVDGKLLKTNFNRRATVDESENFDVLELVMPDGIEEFNRSLSTCTFCDRNFELLFIITFSAIVNTFL